MYDKVHVKVIEGSFCYYTQMIKRVFGDQKPTEQQRIKFNLTVQVDGRGNIDPLGEFIRSLSGLYQRYLSHGGSVADPREEIGPNSQI